MRYAYGVFLGAVLPFVIFLGAAIILILGLSWDVFTLWFVVSLAIGIVPPILVFFAKRDTVREFLIFEAGGFGLFSPLWIVIFADLTGTPWTVLFNEGVVDCIPTLGLGSSIQGMIISGPILTMILAVCLLVGIIFLRPSFIDRYGTPGEPAELRDLKKSAEPSKKTVEEPPTTAESDEDPIESEMPEVAPPKANVDTMANLRELLVELGTPEPTINLIFNAGIATTTDLVATSPEQLANLTGIDKRTAEDLHMAVQKKMWFGGI
ncbi:MAG: helix-hairpin-helix domain-containing protein [Promethearchaeota archaeon]